MTAVRGPFLTRAPRSNGRISSPRRTAPRRRAPYRNAVHYLPANTQGKTTARPTINNPVYGSGHCYAANFPDGRHQFELRECLLFFFTTLFQNSVFVVYSGLINLAVYDAFTGPTDFPEDPMELAVFFDSDCNETRRDLLRWLKNS